MKDSSGRGGGGANPYSLARRTDESAFSSKKLLRLTLSATTDLRQCVLALLMVSFFGSSMSLVWSFTAIAPYYRSRVCIRFSRQY